MPRYGQFCPVAQASEVLNERWTLLVVREMLKGSTRFNDIQRGVPLMSSSLLSRRLRSLQGAGVLERTEPDGRGSAHYSLTPAGRALGPVLEQLRHWGEHWLQREVTAEEADAGVLMWDIRRSVIHEALPGGRVVVAFRFRDGPQKLRAFWLVVDDGSADLCLSDPGFGIDASVEADPVTMAEVWLGRIPLSSAITRGQVAIEGPDHNVRELPRWLGLTPDAAELPLAIRRL